MRLRGVVRRGDEVVYSTAEEPGRALMVRCGNRREACCPSWAHEYRDDMWQLVSRAWRAGASYEPDSAACAHSCALLHTGGPQWAILVQATR